MALVEIVALAQGKLQILSNDVSADPSLKRHVTARRVFCQVAFDFVPGIVIFIIDERKGFHISSHRRVLYVSAWLCGASTGQMFR